MFYEFESQSLFLTETKEGGESNCILVTGVDWLIPLNCHFLIIAVVGSKTAEEEWGNIQKLVRKQQNNVNVFLKTAYMG